MITEIQDFYQDTQEMPKHSEEKNKNWLIKLRWRKAIGWCLQGLSTISLLTGWVERHALASAVHIPQLSDVENPMVLKIVGATWTWMHCLYTTVLWPWFWPGQSSRRSSEEKTVFRANWSTTQSQSSHPALCLPFHMDSEAMAPQPSRT